uniref:non-specific serine/threonine protein kinase n=1 Tax=Syphacia muris TaxID=451379 RepID=A0A0N5AJ25_9BILA
LDDILINQFRRIISLRKQVGLYDICKAIGKGNFAIVRVAKHIVAKCKVAVKIVDKAQISQENLAKIEREIRILKTLDHPHIIKLYQVMRTEQFIYIVTEYARNGELVLAAHGKLPEDESRKYFQQIVSAVAYCHHRGIVHRDIKAENILLDKNNDVKLIDFGFSNIQQPKVLMSTWCGSPPYAAPELLLGKVYDGTKADIWSLGVVLFIMVTGGFPFAGEDVEKLKNAVIAGHLRIPFWVAPDCCDLLRKMIVVYPERRINIDSVAQHRLIRETPVDRLLPDSSVSKIDNIVLYHMHRLGHWSKSQISEVLMKKNYESSIYATYELFRSKLEEKGVCHESPEVLVKPRRGSRGSITTGKANIDDEPSPPTISARSLAILSLSDSSDEVGFTIFICFDLFSTEVFLLNQSSDDDLEKDDLSLSPAESWLCHAAQLGPVVGVEDPSTSLSRTEARRHTLVGISELDTLYTAQQVFLVLDYDSFKLSIDFMFFVYVLFVVNYY